MRANDVDAAIDRVAQRQHGAFNGAQAAAVGVTAKMRRVRVANGRWWPAGPSVFVLPSHPSTWLQRVMIAVLSLPGAVASGCSSAALHRYAGFVGGRPEVTVPRGHHHRSSLACVRQSDLIETAVVDGIPTLSARLTLVELAGRVPRVVLESALESGLRTGALRLGPLAHLVDELRGSRRPGLTVLEELVAERIGGGAPSASELEIVFYDCFDRQPLTPFVRQPPLPWSTTGERGDGLVVPSRLLLEADGRTWHEQRSAMARDRARDRLAVRHGLRPLRFTWSELHHHGSEVRDEVIAIHRSVLAPVAA